VRYIDEPSLGVVEELLSENDGKVQAALVKVGDKSSGKN